MNAFRITPTLGALALFLGALSPPCSGQGLLLGPAGLGEGPPSFLVDRLWWRETQANDLSTAPLTVLSAFDGVRLGTDWAPLYRGRSGRRLEHSESHVAFGVPVRALVLGAELRQEAATFRGGESRWSFDAGGAPLRAGTAALGLARRELGAALAVSATPEGRTGGSIEAFAPVARDWRAEVRASWLPRRGVLDARWDDEAVHAPGEWTERRSEAVIARVAGTNRVRGVLESFDRTAARASELNADALEPALAWRGVRGAWDYQGARVRGSVELRHGDGRQRLVLCRGPAPYAVASGPIREDAVALRLAPATSRWRTLGWAGRTQDVTRGSLALWPFDATAGALGTRLAARTQLSLRHWGLGLERSAPARGGWGAGLALWSLHPEGRYESWRATLYGLGRDDYDEAALGWRSALLAGVRASQSLEWGGVSLRLEAAQWVPVRVEDVRATTAATPPAGPPAAKVAAQARNHSREWGGTLIRLELSAPLGPKPLR